MVRWCASTTPRSSRGSSPIALRSTRRSGGSSRCATTRASSWPSTASTTSATGSHPRGPPRRYDTRFFVARAPDKQVALHDDRETIANTWIRPQDALDAHERGEFEIIFPTIKNLSAIARFDDADALVAVAATATTVPTVQPRIVQEGEQMRILLPR